MILLVISQKGGPQNAYWKYIEHFLCRNLIRLFCNSVEDIQRVHTSHEFRGMWRTGMSNLLYSWATFVGSEKWDDIL